MEKYNGNNLSEQDVVVEAMARNVREMLEKLAVAQDEQRARVAIIQRCVNEITQSFAALKAEDYLKPMEPLYAFARIGKQMQSVTGFGNTTQRAQSKEVTIPVDLAVRLTETFEMSRKVAPEYVPPSEELAQISEAGKRKLITMTFDRAVNLFAALLALLSVLFGLLPDSQLQQIIEQNGRIIERQEEQLELDRKRDEDYQELIEFIQGVQDTVICFGERLEPLGEQLEEFGELVENLGDTPDSARQEEDADCLE